MATTSISSCSTLLHVSVSVAPLIRFGICMVGLLLKLTHYGGSESTQIIRIRIILP